MSIFPKVNISTANKEEVLHQKMGRTFLFDFKTGQLIFKDGKPVKANYKQAAQQWIELLLRTELNKYEVYKETNFGMLDLYNLRGHNLISSDYLQAEIKREITEKLESCKLIKRLENILLNFTKNKLVIKLTVILEHGELMVNEVEL